MFSKFLTIYLQLTETAHYTICVTNLVKYLNIFVPNLGKLKRELIVYYLCILCGGLL